MNSFLVQAAIYLGAAAIAVPLFNRLKLGSIVGFLVAGMIVGPFGLGLIEAERNIFDIASLGIVLFLFVIGLELSLSRLWSLRKDIFGLGAAQMAVTGAAIAGLLIVTGVMEPPAAAIAGLALATSATVLSLQYLRERNELHSGYGARVFPVLLAQDLIVIPVLIAIPVVAGAIPDVEAQAGWREVAKVVGVIAGLVLVGRFGLNRLLGLIANSGSREAFAATALFIVAAVALLVSWAGLSMALGAFLAGVFLADSAYRHQIITDIEPFRGLLLGLFFIAIGMQLDLVAIYDALGVIVAATLGLIALKTALMTVLARLFGLGWRDALKTGALLSQGGEFAFVVASLGADANLFTSAQATMLTAIVALSLMTTPLVMMLARRVAAAAERSTDGLERAHAQSGHVIVIGFGRMGQIISQILQNSGESVVAIERNPAHIHNAERYGFKVYYGDGGRLDTLITAGALEARAVVLCMDDRAAVINAVAALREQSPTLPIFAVAHDRMHEIELRPLRPDVIVRETLESSLKIAREALARLGREELEIDDIIQEFRKRDRERLLAQMDYGPEAGMDIMHTRYGAARRD